MLESQPAHRQRQRYRIYDAAEGLVEEGMVEVADMVERQPWLGDEPFPAADAGGRGRARHERGGRRRRRAQRPGLRGDAGEPRGGGDGDRGRRGDRRRRPDQRADAARPAPRRLLGGPRRWRSARRRWRRCGLDRHGLEWAWPEVDLSHPFDGGAAAAMLRSIEATAAGLGAAGPAWKRALRRAPRRPSTASPRTSCGRSPTTSRATRCCSPASACARRRRRRRWPARCPRPRPGRCSAASPRTPSARSPGRSAPRSGWR